MRRDLMFSCRGVVVTAMVTFVLICVIKWPYDKNLQEDFRELWYKMNCETCALIGTAGTLLGSEMGPKIDANDCVFRMGFSPVDGFESDVGSKTTARIVDSLRFGMFAKHSKKLTKRRFKSDFWIIFDGQASDRKKFGPLVEGRVDVIWLNKLEHALAYDTLREYGKRSSSYNLKAQHSAFWFIVKIMNDFKCLKRSIYGVPDAKLCKRKPDIAIKTKYWNQKKNVDLCRDGLDGSIWMENSSLPLESPSLLERRAFQNWLTEHKNQQVEFFHPTWPDS